MNLHVLLKRLMMADVALIFVTLFFAGAFADAMPPELRDYNERLLTDDVYEMSLAALGIPILALLAFSYVNLWKLKKRGRTYFCAFWLSLLLWTAAAPAQASLPIENVCETISVLIHGVIFGLIYFSDLRFHFTEKPTELV